MSRKGTSVNDPSGTQAAAAQHRGRGKTATQQDHTASLWRYLEHNSPSPEATARSTKRATTLQRRVLRLEWEFPGHHTNVRVDRESSQR